MALHKKSPDIATYEENLKKVLENINLFSSYAPATGTATYHLSFRPESKISITLFSAAIGVSAGSLFLLPMAVPVNYELEAVLFENGKKLNHTNMKKRLG